MAFGIISSSISPAARVAIFLLNFFSLLRRQQEAELKLIEEETMNRVEESIRRKVEECINSKEIKLEIQRLLEEGRKRLYDEVAAQLEKEKEAAIIEARQKEVYTLEHPLSSSFFTLVQKSHNYKHWNLPLGVLGGKFRSEILFSFLYLFIF